MVGSRIIKWCHFQWHWMTQISRARHYSTLNILETVQDRHYKWPQATLSDSKIFNDTERIQDLGNEGSKSSVKRSRCHRRRDRDAQGVEKRGSEGGEIETPKESRGREWGGSAPLSPVDWDSGSFASGIRGGTTADNGFWCILSLNEPRGDKISIFDTFVT